MVELTPIDLKHIQLPKIILDRPGFAFLKQGALTFKAASSGHEEASGEKW